MIAATVLGSSMAFLDATVVNVALPTIGKDLHASALTIDNDVLRASPAHPVAEPECRACCAVGAPPLEPGNQVEA